MTKFDKICSEEKSDVYLVNESCKLGPVNRIYKIKVSIIIGPSLLLELSLQIRELSLIIDIFSYYNLINNFIC